MIEFWTDDMPGVRKCEGNYTKGFLVVQGDYLFDSSYLEYLFILLFIYFLLQLPLGGQAVSNFRFIT